MRSRLLKILIVLPVAIGLWIIGWTMSIAGENKPKNRKPKRNIKSRDDFVTIIPAVLEEDLENPPREA
jgi:uncharacterized membrane protein